MGGQDVQQKRINYLRHRKSGRRLSQPLPYAWRLWGKVKEYWAFSGSATPDVASLQGELGTVSEKVSDAFLALARPCSAGFDCSDTPPLDGGFLSTRLLPQTMGWGFLPAGSVATASPINGISTTKAMQPLATRIFRNLQKTAFAL